MGKTGADYYSLLCMDDDDDDDDSLYIHSIFATGTCVSFNFPACQNFPCHLSTSEVFDDCSEERTPKPPSPSVMKTLRHLNIILANQVSVLHCEHL
jgi:hypothetical protein